MRVVANNILDGDDDDTNHEDDDIYITRSLGALRAPTSSWRPFGPLDFVLRALRALRPCDPRVDDWIACWPLVSVLAVG